MLFPPSPGGSAEKVGEGVEVGEEDGEEGEVQEEEEGDDEEEEEGHEGSKNPPPAARQAPCPAWATLYPRATPSNSGGPHAGLAPACPPLRHPTRTRTRTLCPIPALCCHTRRKVQAIARYARG